MFEIAFKPSFLRQFKKLPHEVQIEAREKMEQFKDPTQHDRLRVHKLRGKLEDFYAFSITYSHRVVFQYERADLAVFFAVGTHDVYN